MFVGNALNRTRVVYQRFGTLTYAARLSARSASSPVK